MIPPADDPIKLVILALLLLLNKAL
jgi:hypothetical protein